MAQNLNCFCKLKRKLKNIRIKLKEVYLPFLIVSIATILFYNLFRWVFDIKLGIIPLKQDLLTLWIPFVLPWISILIWLRRRIRILRVRGKSDNGHFIYQFAIAGTIAVPIIISQHYIEKASFDLVSVMNVRETEYHTNAKYFVFHSFIVNKKGRLPYATARTSGKNNDNLNFHLYLACPFENSNNVWYGVEYKMTLSNRLNVDRKNSEYISFLKKSEKEFETYDFQNVKYFEKLSYSDDRDGFIEAIKESYPKISAAEHIILIPKSEIFEARLGNTLAWIFGSYGIGAFIVLLMVIIPKIDKKELRDFKKDQPLKDDDLKDILEFFDPRGTNKATAILLLLNLIVFVTMVLSGLNIISPTAKELLEIGGNRRLEVMDGEYWRLFTSIFIHGGIIHLFMNLFGLGLSANLLEGILGRIQLILSYVFCGIFGSLASIYWHANTVSVGASGAIFGLYGLILAFTVFKIYPNYMRGMIWMFLGLYAGVSLLLGFFGGIDNAAHVGGLISGFFIGGILILTQKEKLINNAN